MDIEQLNQTFLDLELNKIRQVYYSNYLPTLQIILVLPIDHFRHI